MRSAHLQVASLAAAARHFQQGHDRGRFPGIELCKVGTPCQIETQTGLKLEGAMLDFDPSKRRLQFRASPGGTYASLPFTGVRRLTLTAPLLPAARNADAPHERLPSAAQERDYTVGPAKSIVTRSPDSA